MNPTTVTITALFDRIPRRHSVENVKEINIIVSEYEGILINIEAVNAWHEKNITVFFDELDEVRSKLKMPIDNKASKKNKDRFFDEASGVLKDSMQSLMAVYGDGKRME